MNNSVFTVEEFCKDNRISRGTFYNLLKRGSAPVIMKVGSRVLVSQESAAEWRRKMETQSTQAAA